MASKNEPNIDDEDIGCIRWASNSQLSSSTPTNDRKSQTKIKIYDEFSSSSNPIAPGNMERGSFSMDVHAFEKSLQEKRDRQMHHQSPRIEIRLRETSTTTPRTPTTPLSRINIHHIERGGGIEVNTPPGPSTSIDEVDFISEVPRKVKRVITYEKVSKTKTIREVTYPEAYSSSETVQSPTTVQRTMNYSLDKSSSTEQMTGAEDSAYHSHRVRLLSSGTPTTISISSSSNSLQHAFRSDENVYAHQTPSRERMYERAGSEPPHFGGRFTGIDTTRNIQSSLDSTRIAYDDELMAQRQRERQFVSPVTDGNQNAVRRHFEAHRTPSSSGDGISSEWYNEYQTQTVAVDRTPRMDFKRSNSQYDNHIRQIRGI